MQSLGQAFASLQRKESKQKPTSDGGSARRHKSDGVHGKRQGYWPRSGGNHHANNLRRRVPADVDADFQRISDVVLCSEVST